MFENGQNCRKKKERGKQSVNDFSGDFSERVLQKIEESAVRSAGEKHDQRDDCPFEQEIAEGGKQQIVFCLIGEHGGIDDHFCKRHHSREQKADLPQFDLIHKILLCGDAAEIV